MTKRTIEGKRLIESILITWCIMQFFTGAVYRSAETVEDLRIPQNIYLFFIVFILCTAVIYFIVTRIFSRPAWVLLVAVFVYSVMAASVRGDIWFTTAVLCLTGTALFYALNEGTYSFDRIQWGKRETIAVYILLAGLFIMFTGGLTALRYFTFRAPCFDLGIFAQMFEQMRQTGLPVTTCERNTALSHFAVHLSPVYYLILPFYWLAPHPVTLQVVQAVVAASGCIPLYRLCKRYGLSNISTALLGITYFFYPALTGSCFYDIHENMFLTPFLLWMYDMAEEEKWKWVWAAAILTLLVKEDAPIYVAFFGLYLTVSAKKKKTGTLLFAISLIYFGFAVWYLNRWGDGIMVNRYDNYIQNGQGVMQMAEAVFADPGYVLRECFSEEKIIYLLQILLPVGALALATRKFSDFVLLGPIVLINLMPDYYYQHTIDFQYNFGTTAILFYLAVMHTGRMKRETKRYLLLFCTLASVILFSAEKLEKINYVNSWQENRETYHQMEEVLDRIPKEASVTASTFFVAHLFRHKELYSLPNIHDTDYAVVDLRYQGGEQIIDEWEERGYKIEEYQKGVIACLKKSADAE